ncbi:uncharacterized protein LOC115349137 [Aquila chrysaetos chrysaetos]|uniref:uncharacterized protein LOC115349137 n=1 Tax=Aquila chrysaetos chrysaetos TaxID=223781 RepID=UPI0011768F98|nr:uncharacterized protein LOC115349137 [Aquila chrysaetos chrysaetos]
MTAIPAVSRWGFVSFAASKGGSDSTANLPPVINHLQSDTSLLPPSFFSLFFCPWVCNTAALAAARRLLRWGCRGELGSDAAAAGGDAGGVCWLPRGAGLQCRSWLWAGETGKVQIPGGQEIGAAGGGGCPCFPALSTPRGWASGSPRSPRPLLRRGGETMCPAQMLPQRDRYPPWGHATHPGTTGPPVAAGNSPSSNSASGTHRPPAAGSKTEASLRMEAATSAPARFSLPSQDTLGPTWRGLTVGSCSCGKRQLVPRASVAVTHPRPLSSEQEEKEGAKLPPVAAGTGSHRAAQGWEGAGEESPSTLSPPRPPGARTSLWKPLFCRDARRDPGAVFSPRTDRAPGNIKVVCRWGEPPTASMSRRVTPGQHQEPGWHWSCAGPHGCSCFLY